MSIARIYADFNGLVLGGKNGGNGLIPMKVKIFESSSNFKIDPNSLDDLESQVAEWLKDNASINVVDIKQSAAGGSGVQCSYSYQSGMSRPPNQALQRTAAAEVDPKRWTRKRVQ